MYNLSIIIPHYNSADTLGRLLESIPKKEDIQVIVVDDKSDEKLKELSALIQEYSNDNIQFFNNTTPKKGAGVCRNIGLKHAKGQWLLFADSDDFFLEFMYEVVSSYFSSDNDIIYFTPTSLEIETGNISDRHIQYKNLIDNYIRKPNRQNENLLRYKFYVPWSKLISSKLIAENHIQFDEVQASNDVMFSAKIGYYADRLKVSQETIYCSVKHKGSLMTQVSEAVYDSRLNVWINYYNFLRGNLSEEEFEKLDVKTTGRGYLIRAVKYKFSFRKVINIYKKLKSNDMPVFEKKLLNPFFLISALKKRKKLYDKEKKYYTK